MRRASAGTGVVGLLLLGVVALVGSASPAAAAIGDINTFADAGVIDPDQMAAADDGTMWFTATAVVGSISPSGTIATSNDATIIGGTRDVTVGGDDSVWFSTSTGLVRRDPGTGTFAAIPIAGDAPTLLTTTSDGDVWFVDEGNDVWSIPSDGDTTTPTLEEDLDPSTGDEVISDMAPDLAGGIWAVQPAGSLGSLLHVDAGGPLTATILTEDSKVAGQGTRLAVAPDGTVWFTPSADVMGRFTPTDGIDVLPIAESARALAVGADGNVWYRSDAVEATIDRLRADGQVTSFADPEDEVQSARWMAAGTDGQIWFTDDDADRIGFIETVQEPGVPTAFQAVGGNGQVSLTWTAPTDDGGSALAGYRLTRIGAGTVELPASQTSYVFGGLINGTTYEFEVVAQNALGDSLANFDTATPRTVPSRPPSLTVTPSGVAGEIDVTWTAPTSTGGSPLTGYVLYRDDLEVEELGPSALSFTDTGLTNRTSYQYEVAAVSVVGASQRSVVRTAVPIYLCPSSTHAFADVQVSHPFFHDVCWMDLEQITTGFPDGTFRPSTAVSRGAMSAFMFRLADVEGFDPPNEPTFDDVSTGHRFFDEIEWMAEEDITTGFGDGTYRPSTAVTRSAMSAFLYRLAGNPLSPSPSAPTFSDVSFSHQLSTEIEWMAATGISTGFSDGTYRPSTAVSRQSMSAFMHRLADDPGVGV